MSDTPISDSTPHNVADLGMLCRQLERELNAANQIGRKYEDRYFAALDRIKRLEEAGDAIFLLAEKHAPEYWIYTQTAFNNWRKAKEDKL